ncbi:PAS domain S-box-containing protein/diguanylate cyclase (GGDEF)-like protein [Ilumatobacter fluminis]|uniref:PAS domain S-box-containing protein/diguanylate cyclase (GGDEF)-like protein n=1 Tax=Ilumatobacter fluminis TaxID=467091 RepID=A0A4R7HVS4_9ACTN|nr:PAS domain S-box protein [Ilumatobacter fluminis]TDT15107.1 PAS domain S-box-containing protein/diguanylate cyclase (GGDEF)-like protein [Ilumatobacter fluminis]
MATADGSHSGPNDHTDPLTESWMTRAILDQLPVALWVKDLAGRYLGCNQRFASAFGKPESEIVGMHDAEYHDESTAAAYDRQDRLAFSSGMPVTFEEDVTDTTTGRQMRWETTKMLVRDADGEPFAILGVGFDITDRDAVQNQLIAQTERFEAAERLASFGSFDEDVRTGVSEWTPGMYRIFGVDPELGRSGIEEALEKIHPDDRATVSNVVNTSYRTGEPFTIEHRILVDGDVRHVEARSEYDRDEHGQVIRAFGTTHDITDRVRSEQRAESFARLMDRASDAICIVDAGSGDVIDVNDKAVAHFGTPRTEMLQLKAWDIVEELTPSWWQDQVGSGRVPSILECTLLRSDGSAVPAEVTMELIDGVRPVVIAAARDITDRVERERAAREAADQYHGLIDGTIDGFALLDLTATIVDVNDRYCELTGWSRDELIGRRIDELDANSDPADVARRAARIAVKGGEVFETEQWHADGTTWPSEVSITYSPASGGRFFVFVRDLTDTRLAAQRWSTLLAGSVDGIVRVDRAGIIVEANDAYAALVGLSPDDVIGRSVADLDADTEHDELGPILDLIAATGSHRRDSRLRRSDGVMIPVELAITYSPAEGGQFFAFARDVTERREAERRIERLAYTDALTDLPNRTRFSQLLREAQTRADGGVVAVCYLDLDGFKQVNDRFGHEAGDVLLVQLGERLRRWQRRSDVVARIGGDEFVVLLTGASSPAEVELEAQRLVDVAAEPFVVEGHRFHLGATVGVTIYPDDDGDEDALLRHADQAMYRAKEAGKNTFVVYDPVAKTDVTRQRAAIAELESAVRDDELVLHYQPKIELETGRVVGVEALVRWQHTERGLLAPGVFLPLAEGSPLEFELGEWVVRTALRQLAAWRANGLDLTVAVNISPRHIARPEFADFLTTELGRHPDGLAASLELEILEASAEGRLDTVAALMRRIERLGVRFSLDDFGTGYSSLTYFNQLPISTLKIDQGFVRDLFASPNSLDIVEGVIDLAKAIRRPVVAEGVETFEVGLMLRRLGCQYAQGFGIARPMPADEIAPWVTAFASAPDWHDLSRNDLVLSPFGDLDVVKTMHERWSSSILAAVAARDRTAPAPPEAFQQWLAAPGARRYSGFGSFTDLRAHHQHLQARAEQLLEAERPQPDAESIVAFTSTAALVSETIARLAREARHQLD